MSDTTRRTRRAAEAVEADRKRVALWLRDELAQSLAATRMEILAMRASMQRHDPALAEKVDELAARIQGLAAGVFGAATSLRPLVLDDLGLEAALEWLAGDVHQRTGANGSLSTAGVSNLPPSDSTLAFRMAQRAYEDFAAAGASRLAVEIEQRGRSLRIRLALHPDLPREGALTVLEGLRDLCTTYGANLRLLPGPWPSAALEIRLPLGKEAG